MDDQKIIELFNRRDGEAIRKTQEKYGSYINTVIGGLLKSLPDIEELANDTYMGLWQSIPPANPRNLKAYIAAVARQKAMDKLDYLTAQKRNANLTMLIDELDEAIPDSQRTEDTVTAIETADEINFFLSGLASHDRYIFLRRYWFGDSINQIAEKTGVSDSQVKNSLFKTRKQLKKYLKKAGVKL